MSKRCLHYKLERVAGIEPALSGRKHDILPLNYTRKYLTYKYYTINKSCLQEKNKKTLIT